MHHIREDVMYLKILFLFFVIPICIFIFISINRIKMVLNINPEIKNSLIFFSISNSIFIPIISILSLMLILIILFDFYKVIILYSLILLVHLCSIICFLWIIYKTIKWFLNNHNYIILSYIISFSFFLVFISSSMINYIINMTKLSNDVIFIPFNQLRHTIGLALNTWQIMDIQFVFLFMSFLSMWITTSLLLIQYLPRMSKLYVWMLISLPLVYYILQFLFIELDYLSSLIFINPFSNLLLYEILFIFSTPIVGILFGIILILMAKKFENRDMKMHLITLAVGFMLLFSSFQPNFLLYKPFPPFGLSIVLMSIASFMIVISLYQIIYLITKNRSIFRELIHQIGEKNFLVYFSEGKQVHELSNIVNNINHNINKEHFNVQTDPKKLSEEELEDIFEFIKDELDKSNISR